MQLHIGIDDTDSTRGGCTTYIAARLVELLSNMNVHFEDYPNIIRLNPNVPYKTRGNAAVAIRIEVEDDKYDRVREVVLEEIEQHSQMRAKGTDPAVVLVKGHPVGKIKQFSRRALWDILSVEEAVRVIRSVGASAMMYGSGLGLVGALAAVGQTLNGDHTYEIVAYRKKQNWGTPRLVDENSVKRMDRLTNPKTFNNYDYENKRTLITPHGPDPVLLGIRGETSAIVSKAFRMIRVLEPIERWVIFRTNHGTDAHLLNIPKNRRAIFDIPAALRGIVADKPQRISGGHVFFTFRHSKEILNCAAFEPTGNFRETAARLLPGDDVTVYGALKKHNANRLPTLNLEKIRIHRLVDMLSMQNPICPNCGKHMKSAGRTQGFRCERCSLLQLTRKKIVFKEKRKLHLGLFIPAPKAHRHLTKPISRYGLEKMWNEESPEGDWHFP